MASILDRYGIKEVADVTFYEISDGGEGKPAKGMPTIPVLYLDTLKVSTIEQTAENTSARGGKGNPELIVWDYGKEITVTLEDALFSMKSMSIMYGALDKDKRAKVVTNTTELIKTVPTNLLINSGTQFEMNGTIVNVPSNVSYYDAAGGTVASVESAAYVTFMLDVKDTQMIEISAATFPGNYYITGDTYARREDTGKDEFFQFIIPKAKVMSEVTLTMEAEGDPSTFSMNLRVLRPDDGKMMKLIKYDITGATQS